MRPKPGLTRGKLNNRLLEKLRSAKQLFVTGENGGRMGAVFALNSVTEYLQSFQEVSEEGLSLPLTVTSAALADLDDGVQTPMFAVKRKAGRRADSTTRKSMRGYSVVSVELLMQTGLTQNESAKRVAARLKRSGVENLGGGGKDVTARTVMGWRQAISADFGKGLAAEIVAEMTASTRIVERVDMNKVRLDILKRLENLVRSIRAEHEKPTLTPG